MVFSLVFSEAFFSGRRSADGLLCRTCGYRWRDHNFDPSSRSFFFSKFCSRDCSWEFCYDYFHYVHSASPTLLPLQPLVSKDLNLVCNLSWMILGACYVGSKFLHSTTFPNNICQDSSGTVS